jgi:hypothetical protein
MAKPYQRYNDCNFLWRGSYKSSFRNSLLESELPSYAREVTGLFVIGRLDLHVAATMMSSLVVVSLEKSESLHSHDDDVSGQP